jgi:hypothetical protein
MTGTEVDKSFDEIDNVGFIRVKGKDVERIPEYVGNILSHFYKFSKAPNELGKDEALYEIKLIKHEP